MIRLRAWTGADTTAAQQLASRSWPSGPHPGGLGWSAATDQLGEYPVVAWDGGKIVGWACLDAGELTVLADPADGSALSLCVDWALERASGDLNVSVFVGDERLPAVLAAAGFESSEAGRRLDSLQPLVGMFRAASTREPTLPAGYHVRGVRDQEHAARVEAHRQAWCPALLPWAESANVAVDPTAQSRFTGDGYDRVRQTWLYDPDLDLVIEAANGQLVASCLVWFDSASGCAEIEPVGVVAEHRRRGLAIALCDEASKRVAARGGNRLFINTGPNEDYPAPAATYLAAGFLTKIRATQFHHPTI